MDQIELERIEAYLSGSMSKKDRQVFEAEMETDPSTAQAVSNHQKMIHAIEEMGFREMLGEIHQQRTMVEIPRRPFLRRQWLWGVAAGILLLIGFVWLLSPDSNSSLQDTLATIQVDPGLPTTLGTTNELAFGEGMNAYKLGRYAEAETRWMPLLDMNPQNDTLLFYLAQTAFAQEQNLSVVQRLDPILKQGNSIFQEKSIWYFAVAQLRLGETDTAKVLLRDIIDANGFRHTEARTLLDMLN